jgi:hypothetical protein
LTNEEQLSPNMTDELLAKLFKTLPENLDDGELCALTLSIYSAYIDDPTKIMGELVSLIYTFGISAGFSKETVSKGLRYAADMHDEEPVNQATH